MAGGRASQSWRHCLRAGRPGRGRRVPRGARARASPGPGAAAREGGDRACAGRRAPRGAGARRCPLSPPVRRRRLTGRWGGAAAGRSAGAGSRALPDRPEWCCAPPRPGAPVLARWGRTLRELERARPRIFPLVLLATRFLPGA